MLELSTVSLGDVAKRLKVSPMTVSRVINNSGPVSEKTRNRVVAMLQKMGYRKDRFASINASKRGRCNGIKQVVVDCLAESREEESLYPFYSLVALAALREFEQRGIHAILTDLSDNPAGRLDALSSSDALLFCSVCPQAVRTFAQEINPTLRFGSVCQPCENGIMVNPDDYAGGQLAARHFVEMGHRHVALFTTPDQLSHRTRQAGFCEEFRALAPSGRIDIIAYSLGQDQIHVDDNVMKKCLHEYWGQSAVKPTGVFAVGGYGAMILYRFLAEAGISIPGQISLLGYDNYPAYDLIDTPLSRVAFDVGELGRQAATALSQALQTPNCPATEMKILLPVRLIDRSSVMRIEAKR